MPPTTSNHGMNNLERGLEQWIDQRTGGRVHRLRVSQVNRRFLVQGRTGSYHVRQLALAAVMDVLDMRDDETVGDVEIDIQVSRVRSGDAAASTAGSHQQPIVVHKLEIPRTKPTALNSPRPHRRINSHSSIFEQSDQSLHSTPSTYQQIAAPDR